MTRRNDSCPHESEVLALVMSGVWPAHVNEPLGEHVSHCVVCGDIVAVAAVLTEPPRVAAPLPHAHLIWHRAQMRARQEAARRVREPLLFAELAAGAVAAVVVAAWAAGVGPTLGTVWPSVIDLFSGWPTAGSFTSPGFPYVALAAASGVAALVLGALGLSRLADRSE